MYRLLRPVVTTCLVLACGAPLIPSHAAETFEVIHTASPDGIGPFGPILAETDGSFVVTTNAGGSSGTGGVYRVANGSVNHIVSLNAENGTYPAGGVIKAADGNYYGTAAGGGDRNLGTVFRITTAGVLTTLVSLTGTHGSLPDCHLVEGTDGALYGIAPRGGSKDLGTVFKVTKAGAISTVVHFEGGNGARPEAGLTKTADGTLYGVTSEGGSANKGTVFRISTSGEFSVIASFDGSQGEKPLGALALGNDGALYGTAFGGGASNLGTVFRVSTSGQLSLVASFTDTNGARPHVRLVEQSPGNFYGVTQAGGATGGGVIFKVTTDGVITPIVLLPVGARNGAASALALGNDGALYGNAFSGGANFSGQLYRIPTEGDGSTIASFGSAVGQGFVGDLVAKGEDNALYGTTSAGGVDGLGVFFKITTNGSFGKLSDFKFATTGGPAEEGLTLGADGNFYGTVRSGNAGSGLFRATVAGEVGEITRIASFNTIGGDRPTGVIQASNGNFYGTTQSGGGDGGSGPGLFYSYTPQGALTKLKAFGSTPVTAVSGKLLEGRDGYFYGASQQGGAANAGALFRLSASGEFKLLASFANTNGASPTGSLVQAADGNFYGMTFRGGLANGGTVFRLTPGGKLTAIASFLGKNGAFPEGSLIVGPRGDLYGVTVAGGKNNVGVLFKVSLKGKITVLKHFDAVTTGAFPTGKLAVGPDSNIYGTTYNTVFRLTLNNQPPLPKDDTFELPAFNLKVLTNDADSNGDPLRVVTAQANGDATVIVNPDNTITYLPGSTFNGTDTFTYTVSDGLAAPVTATVTVRQPLNPLKAVAGAYAGMISAENGSTPGHWGIVVNQKGLFTSVLRFQGRRYSVRGKVVDGQINIEITRPGESSLTLAATLDVGRNVMLGTLNDGAVAYTLQLHGSKPFFTRTSTTSTAGRYTVLLPASEGDDLPGGTGYAMMNVSGTGSVTITGKLGDGTAFSAGALLSKDNKLPLYTELYKKPKGYIAGVVTFANLSTTDATATLLWVKPAQAGAYYPGGFTMNPSFLASRYEQPAKDTTVLPFKAPPGNATLNLAGTGIEKTLSISSKNLVAVTNPGADKIFVRIDPRSGLFTGKFVDPADSKSRTFGGAVFQKTLRGEGTYLGKSATGNLLLLPVP